MEFYKEMPNNSQCVGDINLGFSARSLAEKGLMLTNLSFGNISINNLRAFQSAEVVKAVFFNPCDVIEAASRSALNFK